MYLNAQNDNFRKRAVTENRNASFLDVFLTLKINDKLSFSRHKNM